MTDVFSPTAGLRSDVSASSKSVIVCGLGRFGLRLVEILRADTFPS
jgi:voltage-gated potassium channel Kch